LAIMPFNNPIIVLELAKRLNLDLKKRFQLTLINQKAVNPPSWCTKQPITVERALTQFLDLSALASRKLIRVLSLYAKDPLEADVLASFSSMDKDAYEKYNLFMSARHHSLLEILLEFPSTFPPLEHLIEVMPTLKARFYSISSSPLHCGNIAHCTIGVVKYISGSVVHHGVCSHYVSTVQPGSEIHCQVRKNVTFCLPPNPSIPLIFIGAGTGVAPYRGFLQDRLIQYTKDNAQTGEAILFFGCRGSKYDFLYEQEFKDLTQKFPKFQLITAFSREGDTKVYVQHKLWEHKQMIWSLLTEQGAHLFVCGDATHMARDIHDMLHKIAQEEGMMQLVNAQVFIQNLMDKGRYLQDVWG